MEGFGKGAGGFRATSSHTARAVLRIIPPLHLLQALGYAYTLLALRSARSAGALGWQKAVCLCYLSAGLPEAGSVPLLAMPASQQLEQDEIAPALGVRGLPVSAEK